MTKKLKVAYCRQGTQAFFVITVQTHRMNDFNGGFKNFTYRDPEGTTWELASEDYPDGSCVNREHKLYVRGPERHRDQNILFCSWEDFQKLIPVIDAYNRRWNKNKEAKEEFVVDVTKQWQQERSQAQNA